MREIAIALSYTSYSILVLAFRCAKWYYNGRRKKRRLSTIL